MNSTGKQQLLHEHGKIEDIVNSVKYVFDKSFKQADNYKKMFVSDSVLETCSKIIDFVCTNIQYKIDPNGVQWIKTPNRFIDDGCGDCKSYSVFVCAVLTMLGIENGFRFASYKVGDEYTHVYSIAYDETGNEIVIDCVAVQKGHAKFDEVRFIKKYDIMNTTKISMLSGIEQKEISFSAKDTVAQITAKCFLFASFSREKFITRMQVIGEWLVWITDNYKKKVDLDVIAYLFQDWFLKGPSLADLKTATKIYVDNRQNAKSQYNIANISMINQTAFDWFNNNIIANCNITFANDCSDIANKVIDFAEMGLYLFAEDKYLNQTQILKKANEKVFFESLIPNSGITYNSCLLLIYGAIMAKYNCSPTTLLSTMFDGKSFGGEKDSYKIFIGAIDWNDIEPVYDKNGDVVGTQQETKKVAWDQVGTIADKVADIFTKIFGTVTGGTSNIAPSYYDYNGASGSGSGLLIGGVAVLAVVLLLAKKKRKKK